MLGYKFILVVASALVATATAIPAPVDTSHLPDVIAREDIPAGVKVVEFNPEVTAEAEVTPASEGSVLTKRHNCNGSSNCGHGTSGGACIAASNGYGDATYYCIYVSRVSGNCTAIFTCDNFAGFCYRGSWIKEQHRKIYTVAGCGICGTYNIPENPGCRATFNYCSNCNNVG